jgi:hypothetical protein
MKTTTVQDLLSGMTRDELRDVATQLNVPRGKEKHHTLANLVSAVSEGKARLSAVVSIQSQRTDDLPPQTVAIRKVRTHKPDKTIYLKTTKKPLAAGLFAVKT